MAFRYLYWAFYGYLPLENLAIIVGNSRPENGETFRTHVAFAGKLLVRLYNVVCIIILTNLMISMMTGSAAKILVVL